MTRLTMLFIAVALVVPGAASAMPAPDRDAGTRAALNAHGVDQAAADAKARAIEEYYASYGTVQPAADRGLEVRAGRHERQRPVVVRRARDRRSA